MSDAAPRPATSGRYQLLAIVIVTVLVMVLGVLVVVAPEQMGVPRPPATPAVTSTPATAP